jgi:hypothetical protein
MWLPTCPLTCTLFTCVWTAGSSITAPAHHCSNGLQPWHCPVQVRSEDLRVFVEVLQSLHPEPADMVQLRASEAQLRGRVAKLQADMDGHHLQQTIKQVQQAEVRHNLLACPRLVTCCWLCASTQLLHVPWSCAASHSHAAERWLACAECHCALG